MRVRPGTDQSLIDLCQRRVMSLSQHHAGVLGAIWGPGVNRDGLSRGFGLGYLISFENAQARDEIAVNQEHVKLRSLIDRIASETIVFDLESDGRTIVLD